MCARELAEAEELARTAAAELLAEEDGTTAQSLKKQKKRSKRTKEPPDPILEDLPQTLEALAIVHPADDAEKLSRHPRECESEGRASMHTTKLCHQNAEGILSSTTLMYTTLKQAGS